MLHRKVSRPIDKTRASSVFNSFIKTPSMVFLICSYWLMYCDLKLPLQACILRLLKKKELVLPKVNAFKKTVNRVKGKKTRSDLGLAEILAWLMLR